MQVVGAHLPLLRGLSVVATYGVCGLDGQPLPPSSLLERLPALSHFTRLKLLVVKAEGEGARLRAGDVLRALPRGAPLEQVGRCLGQGGSTPNQGFGWPGVGQCRDAPLCGRAARSRQFGAVGGRR